MEVIHEAGREGLATVYVARFHRDDRCLAEFVDSLSGSPSRDQKWVAILSSQYGCPVGCAFCDAGDHYDGDLGTDELLAQLDFMVDRHFSGRKVPTRKFKVQFARMGEPAFNPHVIDALREMRRRYDAPGLMPCISTVAPRGCGDFFERLMDVRNECYPSDFQLQFSIHTTDEGLRDRLVPCPKWSLGEISAYGSRFHGGRGRKTVLNFALSESFPLDPGAVERIFDPAHFMVKLTPVNPTSNATSRGLAQPLAPGFEEGSHPVILSLRGRGFETVVSIGDLEENALGSNCGQVLALWKKDRQQ